MNDKTMNPSSQGKALPVMNGRAGKGDVPEAGASAAIFDSLTQNLKQEMGLLQLLSETLDREGEVLRRSDVRELTEHNAKKETLLLKMRMLDEIRRNAVKKISRICGTGEITDLALLASHAGPGQREALLECRDSIVALAASVRERNEANREIIGLSLGHVQGAIDFLGELMSGNRTYGHSGKWNKGKKKGKVVNTEG
jgi:flagellar biosynthesis/type III secretory pathway chaperone